MTELEAIKILTYVVTNGMGKDGEDEALELAVKALKKQVPMKPAEKENVFVCSIIHYRCPVCGYYFGQKSKRNVALFDMPNYCQCGQKIDWGELKA